MDKKEQIRELIKKHLNIDIDMVSADKQIRDLDIDSLDLMEILMNVEDEYAITFKNEELLSIKTLRDLSNILSTKL